MRWWCLAWLTISFCVVNGQSSSLSAALEEQYLALYEDYETYFVRSSDINRRGQLVGDGIGVWLPNEERYTSWGQGMAAKSIKANSPRVVNLVYGGDNGGRLGQRMQLLTLRYRRLTQEGNTEQAKAALQRLYLTLQAYRRLDMTANQLLLAFYNKCSGEEQCTELMSTAKIRLDGYSGLFVRDDSDWTMPQQKYSYNTPYYLKPEFTGGKYNSSRHQLRDEEDCSEGYACCWDRLVDEHVFNSQDQYVNLLLGLSMVNQYLTDEDVVRLNGEQLIVRQIARSIVRGIGERLDRCRHHLRVGSCDGPCSGGKHGTGSNATAFYKGFARTVDHILDTDSKLRFKDHYLWSIGRAVVRSTKRKNNSQFNGRIYTMLSVGGDIDIDCATFKHGSDVRYGIAPLMYFAIHRNIPCEEGLKKALDFVHGAMQSMKDRFPCYTVDYHRSYDDIPCSNNKDTGYYWHLGGPLEVNNPSFKPYDTHLYNGEEWLLMWELSQLYEQSIMHN